MEPVSFEIELDAATQAKKDRLVQALRQEEKVLSFLRRHQLPLSFLNDHSGMFAQWVKTKKTCAACKGLSFCPYQPKGHYLELVYDGLLTYGLTPCAYHKSEQAQKAHQARYCIMDFAKGDLRIDLTTQSIEEESREYQEVYGALIAHLLNEKEKRGIYLAGPPGVGKTYLCIGVGNYFARKGKRVAFVNVPKLISSLKLLFKDNDAMEKRLAQIVQADIAVFDDIGGESVTAWSRDDILLPLLDARMNERKRTYFTSNYTMAELEKRLSLGGGRNPEPVAALRVLERVKALSEEKILKGRSRR